MIATTMTAAITHGTREADGWGLGGWTGSAVGAPHR